MAKSGGHKSRLKLKAGILRAARMKLGAEDAALAGFLKREEDNAREAAVEFSNRHKPGPSKIDWTARADALWPKTRVPEAQRRAKANEVFAQLKEAGLLPTLKKKDLDPPSKLAAQRRLVLVRLKKLNESR